VLFSCKRNKSTNDVSEEIEYCHYFFVTGGESFKMEGMILACRHYFVCFQQATHNRKECTFLGQFLNAPISFCENDGNG